MNKSLIHKRAFTSLCSHVIFTLLRLNVVGLLSAVEGLKEAASTRAKIYPLLGLLMLERWIRVKLSWRWRDAKTTDAAAKCAASYIPWKLFEILDGFSPPEMTFRNLSWMIYSGIWLMQFSSSDSVITVVNILFILFRLKLQYDPHTKVLHGFRRPGIHVWTAYVLESLKS